jgi:hypothetical protein
VSQLRALANEKLQRIKRVVRESSAGRGSLPESRRALAPDEQIGAILLGAREAGLMSRWMMPRSWQ